MLVPTRDATGAVNAETDLGQARDDGDCLANATLNPDQGSLYLAALLYLLAPAAIVLFYFSDWPFLILFMTGLATFLASLRSKITQSHRPPLLRATWPLLAMAAGIVWLSGTLPPFAENTDWVKHYAILNSLIDQPWPPKFVTENGTASLRYSLAYYALPAAVCKLFGASILPFALFVWTTLGLYLALIFAFGRTVRPASCMFMLAGVFILFSGADLIGTYLTGLSRGPVMHIEWWWKPFGSFSSIVTNLFWAPQHTLPALLGVFMVLRHPRAAVQNAGVTLAAVAVWSPFAMIGLAPIFVWALYKAGFRALLSRSNLIVAPVLLIVAAHFLAEGSGDIPGGLLWNVEGWNVGGWLIFLTLEFVAMAVALLIVTPQRSLLVCLTVIFLIFLSLFQFGFYNDLLMRASIPSLGILALLAANAVMYAPSDIRKAPLIILLVIGLVTPLGEIMRSTVAKRMVQRDTFTIKGLLREMPQAEAQYLVYKDADNPVSVDNIVNLSNITFHGFGDARFDVNRRLVQSLAFTDGGLVSSEIVLPAGLYRLQATLDWDVVSKDADTNGAHISIHGRRMLLPIKSSSAVDKHVTIYFQANGEPFNLSFGLGGWASGKGSIALKEMKIGLVRKAGP